MTEITTRLTRLEIAFENGIVSGAQASVEEGIVESGGAWLKLREKTFGLDSGARPEYELTLAAALGEATGHALTANIKLKREIALRDDTIERLNAEKAALAAERDQLAAQLALARGTSVAE
jgi:hypothetical protein